MNALNWMLISRVLVLLFMLFTQNALSSKGGNRVGGHKPKSIYIDKHMSDGSKKMNKPIIRDKIYLRMREIVSSTLESPDPQPIRSRARADQS